MNEPKFDGKDFEALKCARDEARLQAHLFTAEMRCEMHRLEADWKIIKRRFVQGEQQVLKRSISGLKHATEPLAGDLRAAYIRLTQWAQAVPLK